jgi:phosphoribosylaminoimidazole carboxylase
MLAAEAALLNIPIVILDSGETGPAKQIVSAGSPETAHIDGSFTDSAKIRELATKVDVLTVEIEHVEVAVLEEISQSGKVEVHPAPSTIRVIQDKFVQKEHLRAHSCPVSEYRPVESTPEAVRSAAVKLGLPLMLKSRTLAYDGRGNFVLRDVAQIEEALAALGDRPLYAEKWVPFVKEVAVMAVRTRDGEVRTYPAVETVHKENICHLVFAPLRGRDPNLGERARALAEQAARTFEGAGVFGVEMFLMADGKGVWHLICRRLTPKTLGTLYINEIAPRPHNSGHYTIEACESSQYASHLRAILGLPLGSTALRVPATAMLNLIGYSSSFGDLQPVVDAALTIPGSHVHLYGKAECRKGRKMGHVTLTASSDAELASRLRPLLLALPGDGQADADVYAPVAPVPGTGISHTRPLVGVIMGSDSDLPVMLPAARVLDRFGVPYELTIVSAHRTPTRMAEYARAAAPRGLRIIIAGAGGAAHLPGMVAAMTALPVIGVPVKGSSLDGVDSLHSIVQMPVCGFLKPWIMASDLFISFSVVSPRPLWPLTTG